MYTSDLSDLPRWVFKKHTNNIQLLLEVAIYLKSNKAIISTKQKEVMYDYFSKLPNYNPRVSKRIKPLDSMNHRLDELRYYMFGYFDRVYGEQKFIFSPLGNLFLKYMNLGDTEKTSKIFLTMLFGLQFPHIGSKPNNEGFSLYPFRLIFTLLKDSRLEGKLYHSEIITEIMFITNINEDNYEELIKRILKNRELSITEKFDIIKSNEHFYCKLAYEWYYYVLKILVPFKIIREFDDEKVSVSLQHPRRENSKSTTTRQLTSGYITISENVDSFLSILIDNYSVFDTPISLNGDKSLSSDIVKEIYSFYPKELLVEIGEELNSIAKELLDIPKLINEYSLNPENSTSELFEKSLVEGFELFANVEANLLSGAGNTDIECLYIEEKVKFAVEAKSTHKKLSLVNAGRLRKHREDIGGKYTILVTPRYVPSVKYDIKNENIVIIKANTLSEYFYNNLISSNRDIDYGEIHSIINENLGTDISKQISELTLSKFG